MKRKTLLPALAVGLLSAALASCGGGSGTSEKGLVIHGSNMGYGIKWMDEIIANFTADTGIKVQKKYFDNAGSISTLKNEILKSKSSPSTVGTDIIFTKIGDFFKYASDNYFADITDVYKAADPTSGGLSIESRTNDGFLDYYRMDEDGGEGRYYGISWVNGVCGFVRNKTLWNQLGYTEDDVPMTTDEMMAFADDVVAKDHKVGKYSTSPFFYCYDAEYYTTILPVWFAQYEGTQNINYFNSCIDPNYPLREISEDPNSSNFYKRPGILESLKVMEGMLAKKPGTNVHKYQHALSKGYSDFKTAQDAFLRGENGLLMANGSWLENETKEKNYNADFIPTPIVSSIINKTPTINDDATLSAVVKSIRKGTAAPAGVSTEDLAIISDAVTSASYIRNGCDHNMVVLNSTDMLDEAKAFIKYMYSDKGINIYYKATNGGTLATRTSTGHYDTTGVTLSSFKTVINEIIAQGYLSSYEVQWKNKYYYRGGIGRLFTNGIDVQFEGSSALATSKNVCYAMVDSNSTAEQIYTRNHKYLYSNWSSIYSKVPH